jgi:hypothetical protein
MKVGDYVRTKNGIIAKIVDVKENLYGEKTIFELDREINIFDLEMGDMYLACNPIAEETTNKIDTHFGDDKIIIKSSPRIIDLVQVGDYVNGNYVLKTVEKDKRKKQFIIIESTCYEWGTEELKEEDIKSIVTKEQFSAMEYKVESEVK